MPGLEASRAEALAGSAADNDVDRPGANDGGEGFGGEGGEVGFEGEGDGLEAGRTLGLEIGAKGGDGLGVEVDCGEAVEAGALHPKREAAAAAEEIDEREAVRRCGSGY